MTKWDGNDKIVWGIFVAGVINAIVICIVITAMAIMGCGI